MLLFPLFITSRHVLINNDNNNIYMEKNEKKEKLYPRVRLVLLEETRGIRCG